MATLDAILGMALGLFASAFARTEFQAVLAIGLARRIPSESLPGENPGKVTFPFGLRQIFTGWKVGFRAAIDGVIVGAKHGSSGKRGIRK